MKAQVTAKSSDNIQGKFLTTSVTISLIAENYWEGLALEYIKEHEIKVKVEE